MLKKATLIKNHSFLWVFKKNLSFILRNPKKLKNIEKPMNDFKNKNILFLLLVNLIFSCTIPVLDERNYFNIETQASQDQRAVNRAEVIRRTSNVFSGKTCSTENKTHPCRKQCEKVFDSRIDERDCLNLTVKQIESIKNVFDTIETSRERDLEDLSMDSFELFMNFSIKPMEDIITRFQRKRNTTRAENFITWLIENEDMALIFEDADSKNKTFNNLLKAVIDFDIKYTEQVHLPFSKKIKDSNTLMDLVIEDKNYNGFILKWFMGFIEDSPDCDDDISEDCLTIYCTIADNMNRSNKEDLLRSRDFEAYIDDIIEERINKDNWVLPKSKDLESFQDANDLGDNWIENLCGDLILS